MNVMKEHVLNFQMAIQHLQSSSSMSTQLQSMHEQRVEMALTKEIMSVTEKVQMAIAEENEKIQAEVKSIHSTLKDDLDDVQKQYHRISVKQDQIFEVGPDTMYST